MVSPQDVTAQNIERVSLSCVNNIQNETGIKKILVTNTEMVKKNFCENTCKNIYKLIKDMVSQLLRHRLELEEHNYGQ